MSKIALLSILLALMGMPVHLLAAASCDELLLYSRYSLEQLEDRSLQRAFAAIDNKAFIQKAAQRRSRYLNAHLKVLKEQYPAIYKLHSNQSPPTLDIRDMYDISDFNSQYKDKYMQSRVRPFLGKMDEVIDIRKKGFVTVFRALRNIEDLSKYNADFKITGSAYKQYQQEYVSTSPATALEYINTDGFALESKKALATGLLIVYHIPADFLEYDPGFRREGEPTYYIRHDKLAEYKVSSLADFVMALARPKRSKRYTPTQFAVKMAPWFDTSLIFNANEFIDWISLTQLAKWKNSHQAIDWASSNKDNDI